MLVVRKAGDRGHFDHGWLDTYHTFSFGHYHDPNQMGFRNLRVINEDRVLPESEFGMHGHRDMEIFTYVVSGKLTHGDSLGNHFELGPNAVQLMSAGTGIRHSEANRSANEVVHFYQIWIQPAAAGGQPTYKDQQFDPAVAAAGWQLLASPDGAENSLTIRQAARIHRTILEDSVVRRLRLEHKTAAWVQVVRGNVVVNGTRLATSDGAAVSDEAELIVASDGPAEVLVFTLA